MSKSIKGNLFLVLAAFLWGVSFVMQDKASAILTTFAINGVRCIIGAIVLIPLVLVLSKKNKSSIFAKTSAERKDLLLSAIICGVCLCVATNFQQFGIAIYPKEAAASGRSGFITALYVVLVPLFGIFMKKRVSLNVWFGVLLAVIGMCLLCLNGGISQIYLGDLVVLCCSVAFAIQIICVDSFAHRVDAVKLSLLQFLFCGIFSLILMLIFEKPEFSDFISALPYLLYLGIVSCGIAYTLQIIGQKYSKNPTLSSILMSLESVFAVVSGAILINERFTVRETIGCIIMFLAIIFVQLPLKKLKNQ